MSLRTAVAAPFRQRGAERIGENEFVVALSLDRDWFSPEQAKRLVDVAVTEGLLERGDEEVAPTFAPREVSVPEDFVPDDDVLRQRSNFERALDAIVESGVDKQTAVAGVNGLQAELGLTVEAAAVVYARREGVDVGDIAERAATELEDD